MESNNTNKYTSYNRYWYLYPLLICNKFSLLNGSGFCILFKTWIWVWVSLTENFWVQFLVHWKTLILTDEWWIIVQCYKLKAKLYWSSRIGIWNCLFVSWMEFQFSSEVENHQVKFNNVLGSKKFRKIHFDKILFWQWNEIPICTKFWKILWWGIIR